MSAQQANGYQRTERRHQYDYFVVPEEQTLYIISDSSQADQLPRMAVNYGNASPSMLNNLRLAQQRRNRQLAQHLDVPQQEAEQQVQMHQRLLRQQQLQAAPQPRRVLQRNEGVRPSFARRALFQ